jgi:DNA-directed RNA polymerase subunit alpha
MELKITIDDEKTLDDGYNRSQVVMEPLYRGFGHTIGNILRRVLLSRIQGSAVTHVRIEGVNHEFTTLDGVSEDILNIILNLKQLIVKMHGDESRTLTLSANEAGEVRASQIQCPSDVEIINQDLEIANLSAGAKLNAEITVNKGIGYVPAEEHEAATSLDVIPIDSVFTPIKNVSYSVDQVAGTTGQANKYDKLILDVWSDGSVPISDAVGQSAAQIVELMNALINYTGQKVGVIKTVEEVEDTQEDTEENKFANISVEELELSVRSYNCLKRANINNLADLLKLTDFDLMNIKNFGKKSAEEVLEKVQSMGYKLKSRDNLAGQGVEY